MLTLIDATATSLTVSWNSTPGALRYVLQYRKAAEGSSFETLSDKLTTTQARKRNLEPGDGFFFRVGAITSEENDEPSSWVTHSERFSLLSEREEAKRMPSPPKVTAAGSNEALLITWDKVDGATGYELQMRENDGGVAWSTISSSLSGTEVRKKNLSSKLGYQFRVRPNNSDVPFSPASEAAVALGLSSGIKNLFKSLEDGALVKNPKQTPVKLADALGGKEFVLLYASAHWCGPCRQFTPQLANWYRSVKGNSVEVVFLSADHDENGFSSYFSTMPWLAVAFDDDTRESLMGYIRVTGIPRLVVLDGRTGRIVEDNAVGKPLDVKRWRQLAAGM